MNDEISAGSRNFLEQDGMGWNGQAGMEEQTLAGGVVGTGVGVLRGELCDL